MLYMCMETLGDRQARKEISTPSIMTLVGEPGARFSKIR